MELKLFSQCCRTLIVHYRAGTFNLFLGADMSNHNPGPLIGEYGLSSVHNSPPPPQPESPLFWPFFLG